MTGLPQPTTLTVPTDAERNGDFSKLLAAGSAYQLYDPNTGVQQGTLPDKGVRYRVRLGPYDNTDELNRIKSELTRKGFDAAVIKF